MQLDLPGVWYSSSTVVATSVWDFVPTLAWVLPYDRDHGMLATAKSEEGVYLDTCFSQIPGP